MVRAREDVNANVIWHLHIACSIFKATDTHSEYTYSFLMATVVT